MYPRRRIKPIALTVAIIGILVIIVLLVGLLDFPGWILRGMESLFKSGEPSAYTAEEVEQLRTRAGELEGENAYLHELVTTLQDQAGIEPLSSSIGYDLLAAKIVYRDTYHLFSTAIVNRGLADGVEVGMPVIDSQGVVGRIVATRAAVSRMVLISSPDCSFGVIDQRSREIGVVRGSDNTQWESLNSSGDSGDLAPGMLVLDYFSPSADISIHDTIVTSGLSGITPSGIRIGEVVEIISLPEQGAFDVHILPFADLEHIETVGIVLYNEEIKTQIDGLLNETNTIVGPPAPTD
ncbi:MAG: rod shape-determining protein MreC [bacterium]|nr:rod shape-determining protein MreC [bacterium]